MFSFTLASSSSGYARQVYVSALHPRVQTHRAVSDNEANKNKKWTECTVFSRL